ncbi:DMT family transporter [Rickettsiales bacterium]|nr:DMT family transporter [Rickettsiales bacterium]
MKVNSFSLQIISSFFFSVLGMEIKILGEKLITEDIVFYRCLFGTVIIFFIVIFKEKDLKLLYTKNINIQFLRALFGTIAMYFGYSALNLIPLAQASTISFTKVFFVSILATLFLKEIIRKNIFISSLVGFVGIFIIINPTEFNNLYGSSLSIISAFFVAGGIICSSVLIKKHRAITIIFYHSIFSTFICLVLFNTKLGLINFTDFLSLTLITITALIGQFFNTMSYKSGEASVIVIAGYTRVLFSFLLGFLVLNENLDVNFFIGTIFILFSAFLVKSYHKKNR